MVEKLESDTLELKCSAEQFSNIWSSEAHKIPNHTPSNVQGVVVHEGDWVTSGSVKVWKYTIEGRNEVFKEKITTVDDESGKKKVILTGVGGDIMNICKSYAVTWELTPKENGSSAKVRIEFEKLNESDPPPKAYLDFVVTITKEIDEGIVKA